jgi:hypothetical protein
MDAEFIPVVESEHQSHTPFFNIVIENVNDTVVSNDTERKFTNGQDIIDNALVPLIKRDITKHDEIFPEFDIIELGRTLFPSDIPAYRIVYTFTDPGILSYPIYESMRIWAIKEDKVYTISVAANESAFPSYLPTIQNMIDSIEIIG